MALRATDGGVSPVSSPVSLDGEVARLTSASAMGLAQLMARREVSVCEVLEAHLHRVEAVNPSINAVVQWRTTLASAPVSPTADQLSRVK